MHTTLSTGWWVAIAIAVLWTLPWKLVAIYKAARNGHKWWFVVLFLVNTLAILDICYIFLVDGTSRKKS